MATEAKPPRTPALQPLRIGAKLADRFEIVGVLGEGGTGIVYEAARLGSEEPGVSAREIVALKVIHGHLLGDRQIRGRFEREAKILRKLRGRHVGAILDFGEVPDPRAPGSTLLYLALPKLAGPALDQLLRREGHLPVERAVRIALDVCAALGSAHAQGIIHRDLKPANILMDGEGRAVVVDFGMAKIVTGSGVDSTALTSHNMVFGTPEYMAPEQARGEELDTRCDVYALGIVLYELLTGNVPFRGRTPLQVLTAHLTQAPRPPREVVPERPIPAALEAVVLHAMAKRPDDRYPTAATLAAALTHALAKPEDTESVAPSAFLADTDLALAKTEPAPQPVPTRSAPPSDAIGRASPAPRERNVRWTVVWIVAVAIGLGVGVLLSMR
jgi:serine/threonine-protein kinase